MFKWSRTYLNSVQLCTEARGRWVKWSKVTRVLDAHQDYQGHHDWATGEQTAVEAILVLMLVAVVGKLCPWRISSH